MNRGEGRKIMNRGKERGKSQDNAEERRMVCGEEGRRIWKRRKGGGYGRGGREEDMEEEEVRRIMTRKWGGY
jgi:hypothetical protein